VRKPSHSLWSPPNNDSSVFVLFLFVSTLQYYRHSINLTVVQIRYLPAAFQVWVLSGGWDPINPRYLMRANINHRLQHYCIQDTQSRYACFGSTHPLQDANNRGQMCVRNPSRQAQGFYTTDPGVVVVRRPRSFKSHTTRSLSRFVRLSWPKGPMLLGQLECAHSRLP